MPLYKVIGLLSLIASLNNYAQSTAPSSTDPSTAAIVPTEITSIIIKGDDNYPPYSYVEKGQMEGIYSDIIREADKRMPEYSIELQPIPWKRGLLELAQGEVFALYPPYYRPDDRPYMDYSMPIFSEELIIYCNDRVRKNSPYAQFPQDYYGLTVGINLGFLSSQALHRAAKRGLLELTSTGSTERNLLLLLSNRIDCYVNDKNAILFTYKNLRSTYVNWPKFGKFPTIHPGPVISMEKGYLGISKAVEKYPFKSDFLVKFNRALEAIKSENRDKIIADPYIAY